MGFFKKSAFEIILSLAGVHDLLYTSTHLAFECQKVVFLTYFLMLDGPGANG
jgi:hypothetical protein